jgi:hypothetical protein
MKKIFLLILIALSFGSLNAQTVNYQVLEDDPDKAYTRFIAPELGVEYNATDFSVSLGANGRYGLTKLLTLEGAARFDVFSSNAKSATYLVEGGVFFPLKSKVITKEVPIVLSYNPYAGTAYKDGKSYNVEETKSITIPSGQYKNEYGLRGGLHHRTVGVGDLVSGISEGNITLGGIYLGGQMTSQAYVKAKINDDVERYGAGFTRVYFDVMILPISDLDNPGLARTAKSDGSMGWRVGYQWFVSPHDGDYKFLGNSVFGAELGKRPLSGFLFNITWGLALNRS